MVSESRGLPQGKTTRGMGGGGDVRFQLEVGARRAPRLLVKNNRWSPLAGLFDVPALKLKGRLIKSEFGVEVF